MIQEHESKVLYEISFLKVMYVGRILVDIWDICTYGMATISRLLKNIGLFCRI